MLTWNSLGTILAEGDTVEFTEGIDRARRFFRFHRVP